MNAKLRKSGQDGISPPAILGKTHGKGGQQAPLGLRSALARSSERNKAPELPRTERWQSGWERSRKSEQARVKFRADCRGEVVLPSPFAETSDFQILLHVPMSPLQGPRGGSNSTHAAATSRFSRVATAFEWRSRVTQSLFPNLLNPLPRRPES